jgi:hypothetical protein
MVVGLQVEAAAREGAMTRPEGPSKRELESQPSGRIYNVLTHAQSTRV